MNKKLLLVASYLLPMVALAQDAGSIITVINTTLRIILPVLVLLALVFFIIGVLKYIMSQGDEAARTEARHMMINGIIALFVIVSVWGLVAIINNTFSVGQGGAPIIPGI